VVRFHGKGKPHRADARQVIRVEEMLLLDMKFHRPWCLSSASLARVRILTAISS